MEVVISENRINNEHYVDGIPRINLGYLNSTVSVEGIPLYFYGDVHRNPVQASFDVEGCSSSNLGEKKAVCKSISYSSLREFTVKKIISTID